MAHKIAITLVVLALFGGAFATTVTFTPTTSSFVFAPTTSYDSTKTPDTTIFGFGNGVMFGNSSDTTYAYLYFVGKGGAAHDQMTFRVYRRKLFADNYTIAGTTDEMAAEAGINTMVDGAFLMATTTDQLAWSWIDADGKCVICVAKSGTSATCLTSDVIHATAAALKQLYCDSTSGNCFAACTSTASDKVTYKVFAVTSAAVALWGTPVTDVYAQTEACTAAESYIYIWQNSTNATLNTAINVAYRDCATGPAGYNVKYVSVLVATAATVSTAKSIVTDATAKTYIPCGAFWANTTNGLILCTADTTSTAVYGQSVTFAPSEATTVTLLALNVSATAAQFVSASGSYYQTGFFLISHTKTSATSFTTYYNTYNGTGYNLTNGGLTLGTYNDAALQSKWWISLNGTLSYGYAQSVTDNKPLFAYAGAIASSIWSTSGNVLASFVAFVALMIASLFAF